MILRFRFWLIRLLGVKYCGAFGGELRPPLVVGTWVQRWCFKDFGHEDSCAFEPIRVGNIVGGSQPGHALRERAKGWKDKND